MLKNTIPTILTLGSVLLLPMMASAQARSIQREISGTVMHAGKAMPKATIVVLGKSIPIGDSLLAESSPTITRRIQADDSGQFTLKLPGWRHFSLYAEHKDKGLSSPIQDGVTAPKHDLVLELAPAWNLGGKLAYRGRAPGEILGMRIRRMTNTPRAVAFTVEIQSADDGTFSFRGLPPGPWQLKLNGKKRRLAAPFLFTKSGESHEIPLSRAYSLTVRAATASGILGRNVTNARVRIIDMVQYYETEGDEDGRFVLHGIEKGPGATFLLEAPDFCKKIYALEPGLSPKDPAPQAEVMASGGRKSKGRIIDELGNPVSGMTILYSGTIHPSGVNVGDLSLITKTDKGGNYATDALDPAAVFDVIALLPGGEPIQLGRVQPHHSKEDLGTFRLGSNILRVTLKMQKDLQLPPDHKLRIYGSKESGEFTKSVPLLRTQGYQFRSPGMVPGEYVVVFISKTLGISRSKVFIASDAGAKPATDASILVTRPRLIEGTIITGKNQIVPNRTVQLVIAGASPEGGSSNWTDMVIDTVRSEEFSAKDYPTTVQSDAKGKFRIWCLESSGNFDLLVTQQNPGEIPQGAPQQPPMRITNILGRPAPIQIRVN
jgi:hypothetical protein